VLRWIVPAISNCRCKEQHFVLYGIKCQPKTISRNELITRAIQKELALIRRVEINADLAAMAQDAEYQAEVLQMEAEFAVAQWEALQTIEAQT
jgi:hypothetical protein